MYDGHHIKQSMDQPGKVGSTFSRQEATVQAKLRSRTEVVNARQVPGEPRVATKTWMQENALFESRAPCTISCYIIV